VLPKGEYSDLDNEVLGQLLRTLNPEELKQASGDIFGRIYEYFPDAVRGPQSARQRRVFHAGIFGAHDR
jgi:hypothetical protein